MATVYGERAMSEREPQIFEVVPTPLGGVPTERRSRRSRRPSSVLIVVLAAIAVPLVAFIGPRMEWRPEIDLSLLLSPSETPGPDPTRTPRPTRVPPPPTSSPPPAFTAGDGPVPPRLAIDHAGIRLFDTTTGKPGAPGTIHMDSDWVVPAPNGGWWCICFRRTQDFNKETVVIDVRHLDSTATETGRWPIRTTESSAAPPAQDFYTRFDVAFAPDGRTAYLATGTRSADRWTITLESIDLAAGVSNGRTELATLDAPPATTTTDGTNESYLAGPTIRISPDGRRMTLVSWIESYSATRESQPQAMLASVFELTEPGAAGGPIAASTPLGGALGEALVSCGYLLQWLDDDELVSTCWLTSMSATPTIALATFSLDGTATGTVDYTPDPEGWTGDPLLDRANRVAYFWSALNHRFDAVSLDGTVRHLDVDVAAIGRPSDGPPAGSRPPAWKTFISDHTPWYSPTMVPEPGGSRIYTVGMFEREGSTSRGYPYASTGIWVIDALSLEVLDHWPPAASYGSLGMSRDGRWILAIGQSGLDTDGRESGWPATVSVHDREDGRLALQLGNMGRDSAVFIAP